MHSGQNARYGDELFYVHNYYFLQKCFWTYNKYIIIFVFINSFYLEWYKTNQITEDNYTLNENNDIVSSAISPTVRESKRAKGAPERFTECTLVAWKSVCVRGRDIMLWGCLCCKSKTQQQFEFNCCHKKLESSKAELLPLLLLLLLPPPHVRALAFHVLILWVAGTINAREEWKSKRKEVRGYKRSNRSCLGCLSGLLIAVAPMGSITPLLIGRHR